MLSGRSHFRTSDARRTRGPWRTPEMTTPVTPCLPAKVTGAGDSHAALSQVQHGNAYQGGPP
jgi:hypothetical protein